MKKFILLLLFISTFGGMVDCDSHSGSMNMSGDQFQTIDAAKFGKGPNAKLCPVSGDEIKPGQALEVSLSNGKKMMVCCPRCQSAIEKNLKKYESLMY